MRRNIEQVEIKEPPIQELGKKRSCLKRSCLTGCGCIVIFLIAGILLIKFAAGPRPKKLDNVPDHFPTNIPVYDSENVQKITFISGKDKGRGLEIAAFIPKLILSPVVLVLDKQVATEKTTDENGDVHIEKKAGWDDLVRLMKEPVADHRDIVQIEWTSLTAEPHFFIQYYKTELRKGKYSIEEGEKTDRTRELKFSLGEIDGMLYTEDDPDDPGTDYSSLTINLPIEQIKQ